MIVRVLGRGGASVVYLARQAPFDREVAVKVLRRDVDEAKVWERFLREARTLGRLSGHPNVLTVHAAGRSGNGEPYLVTEYLSRGSLGDVIAADGPLPVAVVTRVGLAIADALLAAHQVGILHRDVKPGNVLLGQDGRVKLGDFGIARLLARHSVTSTDAVAFTPEHVAPEILRSDPEGSWTDLYGLASTLATALVGAPPFRRGRDERMESVLSRKLLEPAPQLPASVPQPLARLLTSGLDPEPSRRPSLAEFRRQLAAGAQAPTTARPWPSPAPVTATARTVENTIAAAHDYTPHVAAESFRPDAATAPPTGSDPGVLHRTCRHAGHRRIGCQDRRRSRRRIEHDGRSRDRAELRRRDRTDHGGPDRSDHERPDWKRHTDRRPAAQQPYDVPFACGGGDLAAGRRTHRDHATGSRDVRPRLLRRGRSREL